jgi:hypothetical protein
MEGPTPVTREPGFDLWMLVHGPCRRLAAEACFAERDRWSADHRFVEDDVDRLALGHLALDRVEKTDEFLVAMPLHVAADHLAVQNIQRGEQGGGAVVTRPPETGPRIRARLKSCVRVSMVCEPPDKELNSCDDEHGGGCFDQSLEIPGQAAIAAEPGEGALDHP